LEIGDLSFGRCKDPVFPLQARKIMLKHIIDPEVEEYDDVYDDDEYFAAQEMQQQEGALLKQGDEFKASVWLTPEQTEVVIRLAEERDMPAGELIEEWILERIDEALDFDT
jgi:hypothetical protein